MELGDFRSDGTWESLREDAPEDGRAHRPADVTPELNLAGTNAEVALRQSTLHGIDVERHGDPEAETDHDDVDRDRHLGARRCGLRQQIDPDYHQPHADRPQVVIVLDPWD